MNYRFTSLKPILDLLGKEGTLGVTQIADKLGKSNVLIHKYLKALVEQGKVQKNENGPRTTYELLEKTPREYENIISDITPNIVEKNLSFREIQTLNQIFFKFTPDGTLLQGYQGFEQWCQTRNMNIQEKAERYIQIHKHIESLQNTSGFIPALTSFGEHFQEKYLDDMYYADQYKWMEFGRGKLAEMTFYAKQSQNKPLIKQAIGEIIQKIIFFQKQEKFDAIAITPWSIHRKNQLLKLLKDELEVLELPFIKIIKYYPNGIPIPQKSLKTRQQRIQNARNTIFVDDAKVKQYKKVLLIDDFVGSGSTLNETAQKLKQEGVSHITGFAFVGNLNLDYDVINEV